MMMLSMTSWVSVGFPAGVASSHTTVLGNQYAVIRHLASTGTGEIFLAEDLKENGREVCVKRYSREEEFTFEADRRAQEDELRLIELLLDIQPLPMARMYRRFYQGDSLYISFERVGGSLLADVVGKAQGDPDPGLLARWGLQVCQLINSCRSIRGRRPRLSFRPEHVLVTEEHEIKIMVFGSESRGAGSVDSLPFQVQERADDQELVSEDEVRALVAFLLFMVTGGRATVASRNLSRALTMNACPPHCIPLVSACLDESPPNPTEKFLEIRRELRSLLRPAGQGRSLPSDGQRRGRTSRGPAGGNTALIGHRLLRWREALIPRDLRIGALLRSFFC